MGRREAEEATEESEESEENGENGENEERVVRGLEQKVLDNRVGVGRRRRCGILCFVVGWVGGKGGRGGRGSGRRGCGRLCAWSASHPPSGRKAWDTSER